MKKFFFVILILLGNKLFSQTFDLRKANWGMTVEEILKSEYPLRPVEISTNRVEYPLFRICNSEAIS
jgi:hypothetical protein